MNKINDNLKSIGIGPDKLNVGIDERLKDIDFPTDVLNNKKSWDFEAKISQIFKPKIIEVLNTPYINLKKIIQELKDFGLWDLEIATEWEEILKRISFSNNVLLSREDIVTINNHLLHINNFLRFKLMEVLDTK